MAKRNRSASPKHIEKRIKEGRGQGEGSSYKPWLIIQDVSSQGLATRIKGWKTNRVHHLLSKLETHYFYIFEWSPIVTDIREQFPLLPIEATIDIAEDIGVKHPVDPKTKEPIVMTSDFVISVNVGKKPTFHTRTIKLARDLQSLRKLEKLEIERIYWKRQNVDWGIVTDKDIDTCKNVVRNVEWLHPYFHIAQIASLSPDEIFRAAEFIAPLVLKSVNSIAKIAKSCDDTLGLEAGASLAVVRYLLASKQWVVDMNKLINPCRKLHLLDISYSDPLNGMKETG